MAKWKLEIKLKDNILEENQIKTLRNHRIINKDEIAYKVGDLFVAENVVTKNRRVIHVGFDILKESKNKEILKG